jgi:predicted N-acyltransferase
MDTGGRKWGSPYLTRAFFDILGATMADKVVLVMAEADGRPVGGALNLKGDDTLYGRYWGCLESHAFLHFEACYYQAIEFCIERGIRVFEGGAQGEHKLARGFMPSETWSLHWLRHSQFSDAVEKFLARESKGIDRYVDELNERSPFRADS